jgi:carboxylesterase type B
VANYRLGAYGWLAGDTVERHGSPNAALYDQRLVFEFVQNYIEQVNGDKDQVSAWGNSAGAGSLIHHLTAFQGEQKPLFSRAILWSPAYQWAWDRKGSLESTFQSFAKAAGCGDYARDLKCLRSVHNATLKDANQKIVDSATALGLFPFGPSVDGSWVKSLPAAQLQTSESYHGNFQPATLTFVGRPVC